MSFFSFDRGGSGAGNFWNYGNPEKDGYSPVLIGRLVELSDPPATKFNSSEVDRWDDGNPKRNIRMVILDGAGNEFIWDFNPGGKAKPSNAMQACANALAEANIKATGLEDMLGMVISISTQEPPQGFKYGSGAPRPWMVAIVDATKGEHRGTKHIVDSATEGGQPQPQAQPQVQQQPVPAGVQQAASQAAQAMGFQPQVNQGYFAGQGEQVPVGAYGI